MNNKRVFLITLIVVAVLAVLGVIYFFFWPFDFGTQPERQPPPQETPVQPFDPSRAPVREQPEGPAPDINDPAEQERQAQEALKRQALDFSARAITYSSVNQFESIRQVYPDSTNELVEFLENQRQELASRYPAFGPAYGRTTRSLSANITDGTPVLENETVTVAVQAQVIINGTDGSETISYERITITFNRVGESWFADRIETQPLDL